MKLEARIYNKKFKRYGEVLVIHFPRKIFEHERQGTLEIAEGAVWDFDDCNFEVDIGNREFVDLEDLIEIYKNAAKDASQISDQGHIKINEIFKICSKCGLQKPISEFYKDKSQDDGLTRTCKECQRKRQ